MITKTGIERIGAETGLRVSARERHVNGNASYIRGVYKVSELRVSSTMSEKVLVCCSNPTVGLTVTIEVTGLFVIGDPVEEV